MKAHSQYILIDRSYERSTVGDFQYFAEQTAAFPPLFPKLHSYAK